MRRLHRRNYPEAREPRDVLEIYHLRMLDAEAMIRLRVCPERRLEGVERDPVPAITDSVDVHLEAARKAQLGHHRNVRRLRNEKPGIGRLVRVRREKRRAAGA